MRIIMIGEPEKSFVFFVQPLCPNMNWVPTMLDFRHAINGLLACIEGTFKTSKLSNDKFQDKTSTLLNAIKNLNSKQIVAVYNDEPLSNYIKCNQLVKCIFNKNPFENKVSFGYNIKQITMYVV